ncbi:MAG TPA: HIT domain-containing protein [Chthoniobacterales bacterium]|jgi:ATP adenylyltransferase|nr:HIT domain-containing protein [Chthoniobacterales bacterium]
MSEGFPKDHLESLWSPWRVEYFQRPPDSPRDFLLAAANATDDAAHFVVARRKATFLMLNRFPYTVGHMMAVPYRKVAGMDELNEQEAMEIWNLCLHAQRLLREVVKAQGFNVGVNLGSAGGAGCAEHLHFHIVPRWEGDSNFMPVIGGARILPDALERVYRALLEADAKF